MRAIAVYVPLVVLLVFLGAAVGCTCGDDDEDAGGDNGDDLTDDDTGDDDTKDDDTADDDNSGDDDAADDDTTDDDTDLDCVDADGDTYGEGCDAGPDCDDGSALSWRILTGYIDADGDTFAGTGVRLCVGDSLPPEYLPSPDDCDDTDASIFPGAFDFPDDGIDQDCDGTDQTGGESTGYYVDTDGGDDANPGTRAEPVATIAKGVALAAADPARAGVYIAQGTYTEDVEIPDNHQVNLFGGYTPGTWTRDGDATTLRADAGDSGLFVGASALTRVNGMTVIGPAGGDSYGILTDLSADLTVADATVRAPDGPGLKTAVSMPAGSEGNFIRVRFEVGDSSDSSGTGLATVNTDWSAIDCVVQVGTADTEATGISVQYGGIRLLGLTLTVEGGDQVVGIASDTASLYAKDFHITLGDAVTSIDGYRGGSSSVRLSGGAITTGACAAGSNIGVNSASGASYINATEIVTGDAFDSNVGVYALGGVLASENLIVNSVVRTGHAGGSNFAVYSALTVATLANNVLIAGEGAPRVGVSHTAGPPAYADLTFLNNHIQTGPSSGDSYVMALMSALSSDGFRAFFNNLYGESDCLVFDGTHCVTNVNDVNACGFDHCLYTGGNMAVGPGFAGATDFHLSADSPLIDAGMYPFPFVPTQYDWVWYDFDGISRPQGETWDIGAFEAVP